MIESIAVPFKFVRSIHSKIIWRAFVLVGVCAPVIVSSSPVPLRAGAESYNLDNFARNSQTQIMPINDLNTINILSDFTDVYLPSSIPSLPSPKDRFTALARVANAWTRFQSPFSYGVHSFHDLTFSILSHLTHPFIPGHPLPSILVHSLLYISTTS
ncbi:uncharacterized protein EV420DRAFT_70613 [Desarmillaria tabescens]|uniref:Uncharacterized protein n=1 Tax=Armillaria tabescens TaxID=1929756 RepID=A0AA39NQN7_ARMTA|nr:uncharacterized protein EV420DRAFT_70613 [Desarmillaria tabescens]KAK0469849.1 hypothetical protein EV420DRAFT_70613 [Desarmillaria tabescens]